MHELAIGSREAAGAEAGVPISIVPIDTSAPVSARVIQALVSVLAALAVSCHSLTSRAPVSRESGKLVELVRGRKRSVGKKV